MRESSKGRAVANSPMTFEEIAQAMGISRQAVLQIEQRAMEKIQKILIERQIKLSNYFEEKP